MTEHPAESRQASGGAADAVGTLVMCLLRWRFAYLDDCVHSPSVNHGSDLLKTVTQRNEKDPRAQTCKRL